MKNLLVVPLVLAAGAAVAQDHVIDLAPITVTASPEPAVADAYLRPVTVITRSEIERRQPSSMVELLRPVPGLAIKRTGGRAGITSVFMRGTKSNHVLVLVNGVRANSVTTGGFAWRSIDPQAIQRIEIERGPHSTRYGAGAMGGVIRIYTRDPIGLHAGFEAGTNNTFNTSVGYGGSTGALDYAFDFSASTSDGIEATRPTTFVHEPDRDGYDSYSLGFNAKYRLDERTRVGLNVWNSHETLEYDGGPLPPAASMEVENTVVSLDMSQAINDIWQHDLQIGYMAQDMVADASYYSAISASRVSVNWQHSLQVTDNQLFTAGVGWEHVEADNKRQYDQANDNLALFAGWEGDFGAHSFDIGVRYDDFEESGGKTTGSIAWAYAINNHWRLNASYATAFQTPTFNDLYWPGFSNPDLLPEEAESVEAGLRWQPNTDHRVALQLYHMNVDNLIVSVGSWPNITLTNKDEAEINGLELSYDGRHEAWYWQTSLTLLQARDDKGERLAYRPRQKLSAMLGREIGAGRVQASVVLVGDRPENGAMLDGYGLLNLSASYRLDDGVTVYGRVENLTDEEYVLSQGYNTPGRQFFIGLRYAP